MTPATVLGLAACQPRPPVPPRPAAVGVLQVIVHDEQGRPLQGATVATGACADATVVTDRNGVAITCVYARDTWVSVRLAGYRDVRVEQVSVPEGSPLRVVLRRR